MSTIYKFNVYQDPGHGWVKVPAFLLHQLGVANDVSRYSYVHQGHVYLEEDCDAPLVLNALHRRGVRYTLNDNFHTNGRSRIRGYDNYRPEAI